MDVYGIILIFIFSFITSLCLMAFVINGLHCIVHILELITIIICIVFFVLDKCQYWILFVLVTLMYREIFFVTNGCLNIIKENKEKEVRS